MKKRAYLAALAVCIVLTGSACGMKNQKETTSSQNEKKEENQTEIGQNAEPQGFGTRLVSVDHVEDYITLAEYKGLFLDKEVYEVTEEQVEEQMRATLQSEKKEVTDKDGSVQTGDLVTISYVGTSGGKTIEAEDNYDLIVGEGGMQDGFEDGLIGMKKGETKTLSLVFPEDSYLEETAGATVVYRVTLQSFQRVPEITDKLVASKTEVSSVEEYREEIRAQLEANAETAQQDALKSLAWGTILLNSEVKEYPQADIDNAIDEFKKQVMLYNNESGMDLKDFVKSQGMTMEDFQDQCQQYAESKVKQNLIIQGIMDAEGIRLDDKECLAIQDQLIQDFQVESLAELLDIYGQTMIDEAIGLLRIENFLVEHAVFEEPEAKTTSSTEAQDSADTEEKKAAKEPEHVEASEVQIENTETVTPEISEEMTAEEESLEQTEETETSAEEEA